MRNPTPLINDDSIQSPSNLINTLVAEVLFPKFDNLDYVEYFLRERFDMDYLVAEYEAMSYQEQENFKRILVEGPSFIKKYLDTLLTELKLYAKDLIDFHNNLVYQYAPRAYRLLVNQTEAAVTSRQKAVYKGPREIFITEKSEVYFSGFVFDNLYQYNGVFNLDISPLRIDGLFFKELTISGQRFKGDINQIYLDILDDINRRYTIKNLPHLEERNK